MYRQACLILSLIVSLFCVACSGSSSKFSPAADPSAAPATPHTRAEALAALDALPTPSGVDAELFAQLKSTLRTMLEAAPPERFVSTPPVGVVNRIDDLTTGINDQGEEGIQWNYKNVGDYDMNGEVNISDLTPVGMHFHKNSSSPDWKSAARFADGDGNGEVNIADLTPIGANFFHQVSGYIIEGGAVPEGPFSELDQVPFESGTPLLTGIRMYHFVPAVQNPVYRVVPVDVYGTPGEPSNPSVDFIISDLTRVVGAPGGPTFVGRAGNDLTLALAPGAPSPIAPGDIVVGSEDGGYLLRVMDVQHVGDQLDVTGEPGILADVFLQGGLADALSDLSQVPPAVYTIDLSGQILSDQPLVHASIITGTVAFLPAADVAVNYNQYGGVTYLRGLALGGPMDLNMTVEVLSDGQSGDFPATPDDIPFYEHKMTGFNFDFVAYQNGVPVTMALQYDIYVGIRGGGELAGAYIAQVISSYADVKMGGIYDSTGITDFNEYTPSHQPVGDPYINAPAGSDFHFTAYVQPEIHIKLYGNPVPGNSEDLALTLAPSLTLTGTRTITPEAGYDYILQGSMDTSYIMSLHHIGMDDNTQMKNFTGALDTILSGFRPDYSPPG